MDNPSSYYQLAMQDFHQARRRAFLEEVVANLTGRSAELLSYEEVRQKLRARGVKKTELKEIALDAIIGSVGRYSDFTRSFLPRRDSDAHRWARVKVAVTDLQGLPPIQVYQIGQVYFVLDGNHRVSVARQLGATHTEALVTEIDSKVPLTPDVRPDDLILKAEYADFLEQTRLDETRPGADLSLTVPGQYRALLEHIDVHRYFMGLDQQRCISYDEAVGHWYDVVYMPVVSVIRDRGILRDFPGRTEADLYLWVSEHRAALMEELGWEVGPGAAATDLADRHSPRSQRLVARIGGRIRDALVPDELEDGPSPGRWRRERQTDRRDDRLFGDILVPVGGEGGGWQALEQALEMARCEEGRLFGLHVASSKEMAEGEEARAVQEEFNRRCREAGIPSAFAVETGEVAPRICERARWTDLVVVGLAYPPAPQRVARLSSGFRTLIRRCPTPVLAVPRTSCCLSRALLAYDGSPKADEALFVAAYLSGRCGVSLAVVNVTENGGEASESARSYLETHGVQATFVQESGPVAETILKVAEGEGCGLLIMGGYGFGPVLEVVLGSVVDQVLRESRLPILVCR